MDPPFVGRAVKKPVVIVPGMDHSQFCSPFKVGGDLAPEITNAAATEISSGVIAAFVDGIILDDKQAKETLIEQVNKGTRSISQAWLEASKMEKSEWCVSAQRLMASSCPHLCVISNRCGMANTITC